jgi:hypothetical protein
MKPDVGPKGNQKTNYKQLKNLADYSTVALNGGGAWRVTP